MSLTKPKGRLFIDFYKADALKVSESLVYL